MNKTTIHENKKEKQSAQPNIVYGNREESERFKREMAYFLLSFRDFYSFTLQLARRIASRILDLMMGRVLSDLRVERLDYKTRFRAVLYSLLAFVLCGISACAVFPMGTYPVGLALISAAGLRKQSKSAFTPRVMLSCIIASLLICTLFLKENAAVYFSSYILVFTLRTILSKAEYDESVTTRVILACSSALIVGTVNCILNGFTVISVSYLVTLVMTASLFAYLFGGIFSPVDERIPLPKATLHAEAGVGAFLFVLLHAMNGIELFGFSLSCVLGLLLTFSVSKNKGVLYGIACGMLAGLACGNTAWVAVLGLSGFLSGMFFTHSTLLAVALSFAGSAAYCIYTLGAGTLNILPDYIISLLFLIPMLQFVPEKDELIEKALVLSCSGEHEKFSRGEKKLNRMSEAFSSLSQVFFALSEKMKRPQPYDVAILLGEACDSVCARCSQSGLCWSRDYGKTREITTALAETIIKKGRIEAEDVPEYFGSRCVKLDLLLDNINGRFSVYCDKCSNNDRTYLLAGEYNTVSKLLLSTAENWSGEAAENEEAKKAAVRAAKTLSLSPRMISAYGERDIVIDLYGIPSDKAGASCDGIVEVFSEECGFPVDQPEFIMLDNSVILRLRRKRVINLECARSSRSKKGETVNGDSISFFENDEHYFYGLLCDGMGSGRDAALTSRLASVFIEKLMTCGGPKGITLELLNSFLIAKNDECFTTVDLLEIDLLSGSASFIKAGAAPSFILRGNRIYKVNSATVPAGIVYGMSAEMTRFSLEKGDIVVMVSDGVGENLHNAIEEETWLIELLALEPEDSPAALAAKILERASMKNPRSDDMTAAVIKIS